MQSAQVPSVSNAQPETIISKGDRWFSMQPKTTNLNTMFQSNEPVFTMPISVKPKTREPTAFTDNRIYVSNIPFSFREQDLAAMFFPYGRVLSVEIVTNDRGSKGFGFVTLDSIESCERARNALHESHVQGRIIEVRRATPTRRKLSNNPHSEMLPPPKLCVDLRAPHNQWRTEQQLEHKDNFIQFTNPNFMILPPHQNGLFRNSSNQADTNLFQKPHSQPPLKCMKHSELKLSSNGDYFCKNGEPTTETSLLMCMNGHNSCNKAVEHQHHNTKNDFSDIELTSVFPNHLRDHITNLLDTSNHHSSPPNKMRRAGSVGSTEVRSSESETASDDEVNLWTPNCSPDLLGALYSGTIPVSAFSSNPQQK